jgi:hypothetical protein
VGTIRQKKVAKKLVEALKSNEQVTKGALLESAGFAPTSAETPARVLNSPGVQEELVALGFSVEEADKTVATILRTGKERNRLTAADMIYDRLGAKSATSDKPTVNFNILINNPEVKLAIGNLEEAMKKVLITKTNTQENV